MLSHRYQLMINVGITSKKTHLHDNRLASINPNGKEMIAPVMPK
jgi:hypothetical protein